MIFNKNTISKFKTTIKRMFIVIPKFGMDKTKSTTCFLYAYINKENHSIYPVVVSDPDTIGFGMSYYTNKLFMTGIDFPNDINILDDSDKYIKTKSIKVVISDFKKNVIPNITDINIDNDNQLSFKLKDGSIYSGDNCDFGYIDIYRREIETFGDKEFISIDDETVIDNIYNDLILRTRSSHGKIMIFYSNFPVKFDKIEYRYVIVSHNHNTGTSTKVHAKQYTGGIIINVLYHHINTKD